MYISAVTCPNTSSFTSFICSKSIGVVMGCMLATSAVDMGLSPGQIKPKTIKLVFVASLLSMQH